MREGHKEAAEYVEQMRAEGYQDKAIRSELKASGWTEAEVDQIMEMAEAGQARGAPGPGPPDARSAPEMPRGRVTADRPSSLATAAMWLGLGSLLLMPLALIAVPMGIVALVRNDEGQTRAIVGIAAGGIGMFLTVILAAILFPVFARSREKARQASCTSNLKQIALVEAMYCQDYDGRYPTMRNWPGAVDPYMGNFQILQCPSDSRERPHTYEGHAISYTGSEALDRVRLEAIRRPYETIAFFDGTRLAGSHHAGAFRHNGGLNAAYADGHCRWLPEQDFLCGRLTPQGDD